jgi:hypothetical protein
VELIDKDALTIGPQQSRLFADRMLANLGEVVDFVYNNGIWAPYELDPMEKDRFVVEALVHVESLPSGSRCSTTSGWRTARWNAKARGRGWLPGLCRFRW